MNIHVDVHVDVHLDANVDVHVDLHIQERGQHGRRQQATSQPSVVNKLQLAAAATDVTNRRDC